MSQTTTQLADAAGCTGLSQTHLSGLENNLLKVYFTQLSMEEKEGFLICVISCWNLNITIFDLKPYIGMYVVWIPLFGISKRSLQVLQFSYFLNVTGQISATLFFDLTWIISCENDHLNMSNFFWKCSILNFKEGISNHINIDKWLSNSNISVLWFWSYLTLRCASKVTQLVAVIIFFCQSHTNNIQQYSVISQVFLKCFGNLKFLIFILS